jgi:hypothetical protein
MKLRTIILLTAISSLISCSSIPTQARLKLPPEITYPVITSQEVQCLTDNTFNKIKKRDKLKSARIETLTEIIKATHK